MPHQFACRIDVGSFCLEQGSKGRTSNCLTTAKLRNLFISQKIQWFSLLTQIAEPDSLCSFHLLHTLQLEMIRRITLPMAAIEACFIACRSLLQCPSKPNTLSPLLLCLVDIGIAESLLINAYDATVRSYLPPQRRYPLPYHLP